MPPEDKPRRIDEIKKRLFANDSRLVPKRRPWFFHKKKYKVNSEWQDSNKNEPSGVKAFVVPQTVYKKFFIGSVIFLILAGVFAAFMLYTGDNTVSTERIKISVVGNAFTAGGENLPLVVTVENGNSVPIESSELVIEYPRGSDASNLGDFERKRITLGTIAPGEQQNQNISLVLYGEQGSTKDVTARIEYRVQGSNAIFTKEIKYTVNINTAPLTLSVDAPSDAVSNQDYTMTISAIVGASQISPNTVIKVDYPPGFQYKSATPKPIVGNNIFALDKKDVGGTNKIVIEGTIIGIDGDQKAFKVSAGEPDTYDQSKISVVYNSFLHELTLTKPFIDAHLSVNGVEASTYTANSQEKVNAEIVWSNNLPNRVDDMEIDAKISGNALNHSLISSSGFYDSNTDTIIWDKNSVQQFASVEPGENGRVTFSFSTVSLLSGSQSVIGDPTVTIELSVKAREPSEGIAVKEVSGFDKVTFNINTDLQLQSGAVYSSGPFPNTGPLPPKVGNETTYTINWSLTNTGNRTAQTEIRASLPLNVRFIKSDPASTENITYNDATKEIIWRAGNVARGTGFVVVPRTVSFQVGLTPSLSQVDSVPLLLNDSNLTAQDLFTLENLSSTSAHLTTKILNDHLYTQGWDRVVQ